VQGVLNIRDAPSAIGGFHCVPGFHNHMSTWVQQVAKEEHMTTVQVPHDDPLRKHVVKVPVRAGVLIIFDTRLPHGSHPNTLSSSEDFRMVQYTTMMPVGYPDDEAVLHSRHASPVGEVGEMFLKEYCDGEYLRSGLSEMERKLMGMDAWGDDDDS